MSTLSNACLDLLQPINAEEQASGGDFASNVTHLWGPQKDTYIREELKKLIPSKSPASFDIPDTESLSECLFDASASVKIALSRVSMHMERSWRDTLFHQIDLLHDVDEWEEGDKPINKDSFSAFIKGIILINPKRLPGLGLSSNGNIIAAWTNGSNRLTAEFLPNIHVKWVLSRCINGETERASGIIPIARLPECLAPYKPEIWFQQS